MATKLGMGKTSGEDIFERVVDEHREIMSLLHQLADEAAGPADLERLFVKTRELILAHAKAEEETIYPVALGYAARLEAVQGVRQHDAIISLVRKLERYRLGSPRWRASVDELSARIREHVEEEETFMILTLKAGLTGTEALVMGDHYRAAYERVMSSLIHGRRPVERPASQSR